jgi:hypothetical protein
LPLAIPGGTGIVPVHSPRRSMRKAIDGNHNQPENTKDEDLID